MQRALERGEKLGSLADRSQRMAEDADEFLNLAKETLGERRLALFCGMGGKIGENHGKNMGKYFLIEKYRKILEKNGKFWGWEGGRSGLRMER